MFATSKTPIELTFPADPSFLRIVRLVVSSLAADLDFDIEKVEDLRIASDELVSAMVAASAPAAPVRIVLTSDGGGLSLRGTCTAPDDPDGRAFELDPLAYQIVSGIVDSFRITSEGLTTTVEFRSNRARASERVQ